MAAWFAKALAADPSARLVLSGATKDDKKAWQT
jgi:hypothetical protein